MDQNWWQYGAVGGLAATMLGLFIWTFKRLVDRMFSHLDQLQTFMTAQIEAMRGLNDAQKRTDDFHSEIRDGIKDVTDELRRDREDRQHHQLMREVRG